MVTEPISWSCIVICYGRTINQINRRFSSWKSCTGWWGEGRGKDLQKMQREGQAGNRPRTQTFPYVEVVYVKNLPPHPHNVLLLCSPSEHLNGHVSLQCSLKAATGLSHHNLQGPAQEGRSLTNSANDWINEQINFLTFQIWIFNSDICLPSNLLICFFLCFFSFV